MLKISNYPTLKWALESEDEQTLYCIRTCLNELWQREKWNDIYLSRLEEEFDVFKYQSEELESNFFAYFNTMQWKIEKAWEVDCAVGPSRGSSSGCLLCWLLGIVSGNPIENGLYFWRFANKVRTSILDIDCDHQSSKRLDYWENIRKTRGELGLTQVATFRTLTLKSAIGQAGRGYKTKEFPDGLDPDIILYLSSLIEIKRGQVASLKQTLEGDEQLSFSKNNTFIKECLKYPGLIEIIQKIEKLIVGSGTHAAAVILFDEDDKITDHCSLMRSPNGDICTALDLHTVEDAGCIKFDDLVLNTLDIQATCFQLAQRDGLIPKEYSLKECFEKYINPNKIDYSNPIIWEKLYKDEVLSIFQWDQQSGRRGILAAKPQTLNECTVLNGIIRLMDNGKEESQLDRFVRIKKDPSSFEREMIEVGVPSEQRKIMHEELDRYNGCAATQESFMILVQRLADYTLKDADFLRRTVAKKKTSEITAQKDFWNDKMNRKGVLPNVSEYLWKVIVFPSLGYG